MIPFNVNILNSTTRCNSSLLGFSSDDTMMVVMLLKNITYNQSLVWLMWQWHKTNMGASNHELYTILFPLLQLYSNGQTDLTSFTNIKNQTKHRWHYEERKRSSRGEKSDFGWRFKLSIFRDYIQTRSGVRAVCLGKGLFEPTINLSAMAAQNKVDNCLSNVT